MLYVHFMLDGHRESVLIVNHSFSFGDRKLRLFDSCYCHCPYERWIILMVTRDCILV